MNDQLLKIGHNPLGDQTLQQAMGHAIQAQNNDATKFGSISPKKIKHLSILK